MDRIKYWLQIFLVPLYGLSYLMPRNNRIWLFGSTFGRRFSENPKYLFLYASQHRDEIPVRPVWISHNKEIVSTLTAEGYEAYYYHSLKGIWLALRAGVYLFDNYSKDINFWQSGGALKINLWHGSGNKKTNHDNEHDLVRHPKNTYERWKTWLRRLSDEKPTDYTLATSDAMAAIFTSAFASDLKHIIINGYPRNDTFFDRAESGIEPLLTEKEKELTAQIDEYKKSKTGPVIAYIPTFRESESLFFDVMDMERFDSYLTEKNYLFIAKLHPKSRIKKAFESVHGSHIINVDPEVDLYSFLYKADVLVTDYSSVYTDFMLTERPVVAFDYDWEEYSSDTRSCYIDQDEYMPEKKAVNMEELMQCIDDVIRDDSCHADRMKSRERMFKYVDGQSSKQLVEKIIKLCGDK